MFIDIDMIMPLLLIVGIDLLLGGDNAVVIALACRRLPEHQQKKAIIFGTALAVVCRILLTVGAVFLLHIPLLHVVGGMFLFWVALSLANNTSDTNIASRSTLSGAIRTIVLADLTMGLDNTIAVAGVATAYWQVIFGLLLSIPIMVLGSRIILLALDRYFWLIPLGAALLGYTAGHMIIHDEWISQLITPKHSLFWLVPLGFSLLAALISWHSTVSTKEVK
ncbi:TerC family protein [Bacillaceae bacterium SIJ1]|uniref:TerC family protein n=1 Tax=Litoribacterium kuwaitense TaxID=1398745 RepID=UPI0013EA9026|nr:TerC family protein [Litoribacterium kuwaitense]NGP44577.1 TerC family protein [Litoribacterium kuwaitense]